MWSIEDVDPGTLLEEVAKLHRELKDLKKSDEFNKQTEREIAWEKQHALWLYNKHTHTDYGGLRGLMCRVKAMEQSLQTRLLRSDTYYEEDTDEGSDDELFPAQDTYEAHIPSDKDGASASPRHTTRSLARILTTTTTRRSIRAILKKDDSPQVRRPTQPRTEQRGALHFGTITVDSATAHRRRRRPCSV